MTDYHEQILSLQLEDEDDMEYDSAYERVYFEAPDIALKADVRINELMGALEAILKLIEKKGAHYGRAEQIIRSALGEGK